MSKRMKVVLATIAAVLLLTLGTAAVALAQDGSQPPQAQFGGCGGWGWGMRGDANLEQNLALAVEQGVISQAEADEILAWQAARPAALDKLQQFCLNNANQARKAFGNQPRTGWRMGPGMMGGSRGMMGGWRFQQQPLPQAQTN